MDSEISDDRRQLIDLSWSLPNDFIALFEPDFHLVPCWLLESAIHERLHPDDKLHELITPAIMAAVMGQAGWHLIGQFFVRAREPDEEVVDVKELVELFDDYDDDYY